MHENDRVGQEVIIIAKSGSDLILRDRLQFTLTTAGDQDLVYGRVDLSDYVNPIERKGLSLKEIRIQPRVPNNADGTDPHDTGITRTGVFVPCAFRSFTAAIPPTGVTENNEWSALKIVATTRAYESMVDIGIASPDVYHVEEWVSFDGTWVYENVGSGLAAQNKFFCEHNTWGTPDLHPNGATIVSDLLIGVAADNWEWGSEADQVTMNLDILLIAEPVTVTQKALNELMVQQQDL